MMLQELRHALRSLSRRPGFTLLTMATLGLGIGATTTIFSALYRLNFAQLPFETADRLVNLTRTREGQGFFLSPTPALAESWRQHAQLLEHVIIAVPLELTLTGRGDPAALKGARVSAELPLMLREKPLLGRTFTAEEAASDAAVVVLSEALWRSRFGADRTVIGETVQLGGQPRTVIGVMRAGFERYSDPFPRQEFWLPFRRLPNDVFGTAMAVLRPGVTLDAASAELESIAAGTDVPAPPGVWNYRAVRVTDLLSEGPRRALPVLLGAVALVLLIACANVAGLMIVRLNARRRELAIRAALGARHRRILGTLAVEQLLLAAGAGVTGLLIAAWCMSLIAQFRPAGMPLLDTLSLEPAVLLFAGVLLLLATLLAGVLPAHAVLRSDIGDSLRSGGDRVTAGNRARALLVTGQIAVSVVLLVGAALLIRSFATLQARDPGFDPAGAVLVEIALPPDRYSDDAREPFFRDLLAGVQAVPGVSHAAIGGGAPPRLGLLFASLSVEGSSVGTEDISYVSGTAAAPGFLPALGARFIGGRDFSGAGHHANAVIVNRSFVSRFWPGEDGVGRRIRLGAAPDEAWLDIIAVVEDIRETGHSSSGETLQIFYPMEWSSPSQVLLVRSAAGDPLALLPAIRQVVSRLDPALPLRDVATMESRMATIIARERFSMLLLTIFAGLALVLSVVGLYGLIAYTVQQRAREIGIRVALGASAASVRSLFLANGMRLVAAGLVAGMLAAFWSVQLLRSLVDGVPLHDGVSFAAPVTIITAAALLASWLPARRAARVDPLVALRQD